MATLPQYCAVALGGHQHLVWLGVTFTIAKRNLFLRMPLRLGRRGVFRGCFLRSRVQTTWPPPSKKPWKTPILFGGNLHGGTLLEIIDENMFFFLSWVQEEPFQKFAKKHGVVSGRFCLFIFACFQTTIIFLEVLGVASALVRVKEVVSRSSSILHPAGLVGHKKNTLLGVVLTPFQCACACQVCHVLCQHHFRRPPLFFVPLWIILTRFR